MKTKKTKRTSRTQRKLSLRQRFWNTLKGKENRKTYKWVLTAIATMSAKVAYDHSVAIEKGVITLTVTEATIAGIVLAIVAFVLIIILQGDK